VPKVRPRHYLYKTELELTMLIDICRTSEDLSPEDKAAELLPISVQYLYVLIRLGKLEEAEAVLKDISVEE
jgi:signal recognition particle subunit SRP72